MNALATQRLDGEVLTPRDLVRVVGKTHPLSGGRVDRQVPAGLTIAEILREALPERMQGRRDYVVHLDGHVIAEDNWDRVRVKKGVTITFRPRLQGGNNIWRSILTIVVAIAAYAFAGPIAGSLTIAGFALTGTALAIATAAVATGIMLAGTLAINALFPVRPKDTPDSVASRTLNSIQGAQNQSNAFGAIPVVLGKHRQSPFFAAKPYTEIVGEDQYLRLLFCWGYGPLYIDPASLKIGETPLSAFTDYDIQTRQGYESDLPITLYPAQVDEVALNITLTGAVDSIIQTTPAETDEISVDFTAPEGIYIVNAKTGDIEGYEVQCVASYRLVGSVSWTAFASVVFTRATSPSRRGGRAAVARGQYEVKVQKLNAEHADDKIKEKIIWTALRSFRNDPPVTFPQPLALTALRIRATDQLSGVISTFNGETSSVVANASTGSGWATDQVSQNPADLFRHVLQCPANARPRPDSAIDLEGLLEWSVYCFNNGFKFNQVITSAGSVYDKLADIAAAGRAVPTFVDGKWSVIWDRPADSIVQHFTPRNSWGFQGQKPYTQQPHGWRVTFINEKNGFTSDERIVYDDGYDVSNATLFEGMQFPGVTDPDLIWKHGRFHIAQSRLRPEKISLSVGWEHLVCTRGDRVSVTHDVLLIGLASGRVKSIVGQVVTLDETVTIEDGNSYALQFRVAADVRIVVRSVAATPAGDVNELTLVGDLTGLAAGDLVSFGKTDQVSANYRVQGISHQKDLIAVLTLVDDAPDISLADSGAIPEYDPHVTIPADPFTLAPRDLRYLEVIDGVGASVRALVRLIWQVPRFGNIASFQVQQQDNDVGGPWVTVGSVLPPYTTFDVPLPASGAWSFRVRCIFTDGAASDWSTLIGLSLVGLSFPPNDITNLHQHAVDGQTVLDWNVVTDPRTVYYEVRKGTSWDTGLVVGDVVTQPPWPTTGDGIYHVRAYVLSPFGVRIYSEATASITIADSIISRNIIVSRDEQATGWTGELQGGVIDGSFIRTDTGTAISLPWAQEVVDQLLLDGLHIAVYMSGVLVDIGRAAECRFWSEYEASGILQGDDFLAVTDVLGSGDILGTSPTRFIRAFPIWRFSSSAEPVDVFAPSDVFAPADIFTAGVTWGDYVAIASGTRVERFFQAGFVLITDDETTDATGTKFRWFVDVPDRTDDYTELSVPDTGLAIVFYSGGYDGTPPGGTDAVSFNGGPNGAAVPHVQRAIVDGTNGDEVKITDLTLAGCTVHVVNAGSNVTRSGVNLLVRGY